MRPYRTTVVFEGGKKLKSNVGDFTSKNNGNTFSWTDSYPGIVTLDPDRVLYVTSRRRMVYWFYKAIGKI